MTIDDFREEDFIIPAGEEKSYWGNNVFRLTIGNKQGSEIILNGKKLVIPESKENVVKDFIINSKLIEWAEPKIDSFFKLMNEQGASDLHLV